MSEGEKYNKYDILGNQYQLPLMDDLSKTKERILLVSTILFAEKGFAAVSMRDLAESIGIKPASLYNHFEGKESLWDAVLEHTLELYLLYFEHLEQALSQVDTFEVMLDTILSEPMKMSNTFTCYAFAMIQAESFRDLKAAEIYNKTFLEFSIRFISEHFTKCIDNGQVEPFDTFMTAICIMNTTMMAIALKVQQLMGCQIPWEPVEMIESLKKFVLSLVKVKGD